MKYNKLTVIKFVAPKIDSRGSKLKTVLCQCDCGNFKTVLLSNLKSGSPKSCGCLAKENARKQASRNIKYTTSNLKGKKFNKLTLLKVIPNKPFKKALAKCECGVIKIYRLTHIIHNHTQSCGCFNKEQVVKNATKHGLSKHELYSTWQSIKQRCLNKTCPFYKNYGGRGITLYTPWITNVKRFIQDIEKEIGPRPDKDYEIDRINPNRNYEPGNIQWLTKSENVRKMFTDKVNKAMLQLDLEEELNRT